MRSEGLLGAHPWNHEGMLSQMSSQPPWCCPSVKLYGISQSRVGWMLYGVSQSYTGWLDSPIFLGRKRNRTFSAI